MVEGGSADERLDKMSRHEQVERARACDRRRKLTSALQRRYEASRPSADNCAGRTRCGVRGDSCHGASRAQPLTTRQLEPTNETAQALYTSRRLLPSPATVNGRCQQSSPPAHHTTSTPSTFVAAQRTHTLATICCESVRSYPIPPPSPRPPPPPPPPLPLFLPLPWRSCLPF